MGNIHSVYGPELFCGFPGYKPVPPGWFKICVGFITGTPKGSPKDLNVSKVFLTLEDARHNGYYI